MDLRSPLIVIGAMPVAAGALGPWLAYFGIGRLPGDIAIERPAVHLYIPNVTCLLISVALTLLF